MTVDDIKSPPFYCPECGKKHRADVSALIGREGAHAKVKCHGCGIDMMLRMGPDELPTCEVAPPDLADGHTLDTEISHGHGPAPATAAASPRPGAAASPKARSGSIATLFAAAVVAALVTVLIITFSRSSGPTPKVAKDPRVGQLEAALRQLRADMLELRRRPAPAPEAGNGDDGGEAMAALDVLRAELAALRKAVADNGDAVGNLTELFQQANTTFVKLSKDYKGLHGRIEKNYHTLRGLAKRLEGVEGRGD